MARVGFATVCVAILAAGVSSCYIQGHDSGVCVDPSVVEEKAPFCAGAVKYRACVPREYEWFPNHTLVTKDAWIAETFTRVKNRRLAIEAGALPEDLLDWEGGGPATARRFSANPDCEKAYINFMCFMNFPRCDAQGESMMMCRSVCLNYFRACRYPEDMIRCYDPANFGGKTAEDSSNVDPETGLPIMLRAPFPGQPFRDNVLLNGEEMPVCTPALTGGAGTATVGAWAVLLSALLCAYLAR